MIESAFNQHFQSEFLESKTIHATKSIKSCLDLIEYFDNDQKRSKMLSFNQKVIEKDNQIQLFQLNSTFSIF